MNRRDFLRTLVAIGLIATEELTSLPEIKEYPKLEYMVEYEASKMTYVHTFKLDGEASFYLLETDVMPDEIKKEMLETILSRIENKKIEEELS